MFLLFKLYTRIFLLYTQIETAFDSEILTGLSALSKKNNIFIPFFHFTETHARPSSRIFLI